MVVVSRSIHIEAPPGRVFALLADPAGRARLNPQAKVIRVELESGAPLRRGSVCHFRLQFADRIADYRTCVTEFVPGERIVTVSDSAVPFETRLEAEPEATGTRLTQTESFEPTEEMLSRTEPDSALRRAVSFAFRLFQALGAEEAQRLRERQEENLRRRLEENLDRWLSAIKRHLEGAPGAPVEDAGR
jgi:uncharacterized protein YndB with AHSA1/START domain